MSHPFCCAVPGADAATGREKEAGEAAATDR